MGTADGFVAEAKKDLGMREYPPGSNYNENVRRYNAEVDAIGNGPWCDMAVTMWGIDSQNRDAVGEFAYTVWHAQWFDERGQWHRGVRGIRKGDVVFFDWGGSRSIGRIDHVGVVEKVRGSTIYTIEGNYQNICQRVARDSTYIVGYGRPDFAGAKPYKWDGDVPSGSEILRDGSVGWDVRDLQNALMFLGFSLPKYGDDGEFGGETGSALGKFQRARGLKDDQEYGPKTAAAMKKALADKRKPQPEPDKAPGEKEDEEMARYGGQLPVGQGKSAVWSIHAGDISWIGIIGAKGRPAAKIRVDVHFSDGSEESHEITAVWSESEQKKPTLKVGVEDKAVDALTFERLGDEDTPVGWDAT